MLRGAGSGRSSSVATDASAVCSLAWLAALVLAGLGAGRAGGRHSGRAADDPGSGRHGRARRDRPPSSSAPTPRGRSGAAGSNSGVTAGLRSPAASPGSSDHDPADRDLRCGPDLQRQRRRHSEPCLFDFPTQTFDVDFESLSATINALDGVFGAIYVTLAPDVVPGDAVHDRPRPGSLLPRRSRRRPGAHRDPRPAR